VAVLVDPCQTPSSPRLVSALEPDVYEAGSNFAFNFNLRRYRSVMPSTMAAPARHERAHSRIK
jgi:hypothetical protein